MITDPEACAAAARDFGGIVEHAPRGVICPRTKDEVVAAVRFARAERLPIAARGRGHSTFGQAQVADGIVLDMRELGGVHELAADSAVVGGGCTWATLVEQAAARGVTPPALTDYLHISVGATLSLGGVGGASFRHGVQADNVLELEVVTGEGELVRCSRDVRRDLFDAVRAGMGTCGVIVEARVRLVPVLPRVRLYTLRYAAVAPFVGDQLALAADGRFDYLDGTVQHEAGGHYSFKLTCAKHHARDRDPDHRALLAGLRFVPGGVSSEDCDYLDFALRVDEYAARQQRKKLWTAPHPWLDVFVPAAHVEALIARTMPQLTDERDGMILTYVLRRSTCTTPLLALPATEWCVLFDVLRNATPDTVAALLDANLELLRHCAALGGGVYPIGAVPLPPGGWRDLHPRYAALAANSARFDPDGILTPGNRVRP